jgi:hypothetical protein
MDDRIFFNKRTLVLESMVGEKHEDAAGHGHSTTDLLHSEILLQLLKVKFTVRKEVFFEDSEPLLSSLIVKFSLEVLLIERTDFSILCLNLFPA